VTPADPRRALLGRYVGCVVERIERLNYEFGGRLLNGPDDFGDLQLRFADGVVHFLGAGDGEHLLVSNEEWVDDFAPPLSEVNAEFVAKHGKWRLIDVSNERGYRDWIGKRLASVSIGPTSATILNEAGDTMTIKVDCDELDVFHGALGPVGS
jgi:hypothetical protein